MLPVGVVRRAAEAVRQPKAELARDRDDVGDDPHVASLAGKPGNLDEPATIARDLAATVATDDGSYSRAVLGRETKDLRHVTRVVVVREHRAGPVARSA